MNFKLIYKFGFKKWRFQKALYMYPHVSKQFFYNFIDKIAHYNHMLSPPPPSPPLKYTKNPINEEHKTTWNPRKSHIHLQRAFLPHSSG